MKINNQKTRKLRTCGKCSRDILPGEQYFSWQPRSGAEGIRCSEHYPKPSEYLSGRKGMLASAQEALEEAISNSQSTQELKDAAGTYGDELEAIADDYQSSYDNIPEGLNQSSVAEEMLEKIENLQGWADEVRSWGPRSDDVDLTEESEDDDEDDRDATLDEQKDELRDVIGEHYV